MILPEFSPIWFCLGAMFACVWVLVGVGVVALARRLSGRVRRYWSRVFRPMAVQPSNYQPRTDIGRR